jgi:hypothetical protein
VFSYLAADAFYYLRVADEWATTGRLSFDGEHPANGFHPLWQLSLAGVARVQRALGLSDLWLVGAAVVGGLLLLGLAVVVLGRVLRSAYGRVPPLWAGAAVGLYTLTLLPLWLRFGGPAEGLAGLTDVPLYGTLWSFANGMETPAVVLAFAALLLVWVRTGGTTPRDVLLLGVAAGLLVLARLDTALVVAGWLGVLLLVAAARRDRRLAAAVVGTAAVVGAVLATYLLWNRWYAGTWLPVSGTTKSTFPDPSLDTLRDIRSLLTLRDESLGRSRLYRAWPIVLPAAVALGWLLVVLPGQLRRPLGTTAADRYRLGLSGVAAGVLLLAAYDLLFVSMWNQGHWYLPVAVVFVGLVGVDVVERTSLGARLAGRPGPVLVGAAVLAAVLFVTLNRPDAYHQRFADFHLDEAPRVRAFYGDDPPGIIAWDDGADAFSLGFPSLSGTVLMLDAEGVEAYEDGRLLDLAVDRGYDRFSSVQYLDAAGLDRDTPSGELRELLEGYFPGEDLSPYEFSVEYVGGDDLEPPWPGASGRYVTIRIRPSPSP